MKKEKKNIHEGHRKRLLEQINNGGLENMSDVVALEFILTYIFPRCDTNEISHALLDRFGNVAEILNADWTLLKDVPGMGETSAKKLHLLVDIFNYYTDKFLDKKYEFTYRSNMADFFEELLRFKSIETSYIVAVDAANRVKAKKKLAVGGIKSVGISTHEIANFITSTKPAYVILAHNHPNGKATPSKGDVDGTQIVETLLKSLGVPLVEHIIVGIDGVYGMKTQGFYRKFEND